MNIEEQIDWIKSESDLYDMQGLQIDMIYSVKLYRVADTLTKLNAVFEAAKEYTAFDSERKINALEAAIAAVDRRTSE